jgi:hypothetical protein
VTIWSLQTGLVSPSAVFWLVEPRRGHHGEQALRSTESKASSLLYSSASMRVDMTRLSSVLGTNSGKDGRADRVE